MMHSGGSGDYSMCLQGSGLEWRFEVVGVAVMEKLRSRVPVEDQRPAAVRERTASASWHGQAPAV